MIAANYSTSGMDPAAIDAEKYPTFRRFLELQRTNGMQAAIFQTSRGMQIEAEKAAFWAENAEEPEPVRDYVGDSIRNEIAERRARAEQTAARNEEAF